MPPQTLPRGVTLRDGQLEFDFDVITADDIAQMVSDNQISRQDAQNVIRRLVEGSPSLLDRFSQGVGGTIARAPSQFASALAGVEGFKRLPSDVVGAFQALFSSGEVGATALQPEGPEPFVGPPPPPGGTLRTIDQPALSAGAPTRNSTGDPTADAALLAGDVDQANILLNERGFRIEEVQRRSVNPLTGELFDTVDQFLIPTTTIAGQITDSPDGGAQFLGNPLLDQARFQFEQQQRNEDLARESAATIDTGPGDRTAENVAITELLLDPRSRNLIKILQARDRGDRFVQDFNLPPEVINLFGGSSPELGLRVSGAGTEPNLSPGQRKLLGIDIGGQPLSERGQQTIIDQSGQIQRDSRQGESIGVDFADVVSRNQTGVIGSNSGGQDGFLQKIFAALPAFDNNFGFGPALQGQLTPGTVRGFTSDEIGALQAAFINSGTTLGEQQRLARRSALPGGR